MFHGIRQLIEDWQRVRLRHLPEEDLISLSGSTPPPLRVAVVRLVMQIGLSIMVLAFCGYLIATNQASGAGGDLAHVALGAVLGYWLR
jgi:hypothetical protein